MQERLSEATIPGQEHRSWVRGRRGHTLSLEATCVLATNGTGASGWHNERSTSRKGFFNLRYQTSMCPRTESV